MKKIIDLKKIAQIIARKKIEHTRNIAKLKNRDGTRIVEFTGPSGIGKTYLYNSTIEIFKSDFALSTEFKKLGSLPIDKETEMIYREIYQKKIIKTINSVSDISKTLSIINRTTAITEQSIKLSNPRWSKGIVLDESISSFYLHELIDLDENKINTLYKNRALIFILTENIPEITNRKITRDKLTHKKTIIEKQEISKKLEQSRKESIDNYKKLIEIIKPLGIKYILLDACEDSSENITKIKKFLSNI